jgi:hypothetical protein
MATRIIGWPPEPFCDSCFNGEGSMLERRGDSVGDPEKAAYQRKYRERLNVRITVSKSRRRGRNGR